MCAVSAVIDNYKNNLGGYQIPFHNLDSVSRIEFEKLKRELEELKNLLRAAKIYDDKTGQPDCEMAEKVEFLKKMADFLGVDLKDTL